MRIFLDTNVLVAAFATRGLCADLLATVLAEHELLLGERVLIELRQVMWRKLRVPHAAIGEIEALLRGRATVVAAVTRRAQFNVDADDAWVLTEALAASAEAFVSGDRRLLAAQLELPFPRYLPRELWARLRPG